MKPVFIQSWTIPRKPSLSHVTNSGHENDVIFTHKKPLTAQEIRMHSPIVAFPLFLQTHYIIYTARIWKMSCFNLIFISSGKWHPLWSHFQNAPPPPHPNTQQVFPAFDPVNGLTVNNEKWGASFILNLFSNSKLVFVKISFGLSRFIIWLLLITNQIFSFWLKNKKLNWHIDIN